MICIVFSIVNVTQTLKVKNFLQFGIFEDPKLSCTLFIIRTSY